LALLFILRLQQLRLCGVRLQLLLVRADAPHQRQLRSRGASRSATSTSAWMISSPMITIT